MVGRGRAWIWFLASLLVIVAGFWPSFYGAPRSNDLWHMAHGSAATLWVVLLIVQSGLIGRGNRRLHQRLGWASLALFAVLVVTTILMIRVEIYGPEPFPAPVRQALVFLDVLFLLFFAVLYGLGLRYRRTPRLHVRLMGSTILIGLGPALVRFYGLYLPQAGGLRGAVGLTFVTVDLILVVAMLLARRRGQPVRPFPEILAAFVAIEAGLPWSMGSSFAGLLRAAGSPV